MLHLECGSEQSWKLDPSQNDQKCLENYEMFWRRMEKISWSDRVKNEILHRVKEDRNILHKKRRKGNWIGHILRSNCLLNHVYTKVSSVCLPLLTVFILQGMRSQFMSPCHSAKMCSLLFLKPKLLGHTLDSFERNADQSGMLRKNATWTPWGYKEDPQSGYQSLLWDLLCSKHSFWSVFCSIQ